jgi:hypothetical protein
MKYILALDQGTTSSRAIVFDHVEIRYRRTEEFTQYYPCPPGLSMMRERDLVHTQAGVALEAITVQDRRFESGSHRHCRQRQPSFGTGERADRYTMPLSAGPSDCRLWMR